MRIMQIARTHLVSFPVCISFHPLLFLWKIPVFRRKGADLHRSRGALSSKKTREFFVNITLPPINALYLPVSYLFKDTLDPVAFPASWEAGDIIPVHGCDHGWKQRSSSSISNFLFSGKKTKIVKIRCFFLRNDRTPSEKNNSMQIDVISIIWQRNESIILSPANIMNYDSVQP
jgi:hypothetical protein